MSLQRIGLRLLMFYLMLGGVCYSQQKLQTPPPSSPKSNQAAKASPAYAEILLRKTELESDLESLLISYTEDYPKVKENRFELSLLQKDLQTLLAQTDAAKLSLALGKLMVRRAQLATDLWTLQKQYGDEHPEVKRAKRKVLSFENAIKEILS
jgi:uncharacterized protein involved in exopolysaccharide biosynthesis